MQQLAHRRLFNRKAARCVLRISRIEGYTPALRMLGKCGEEVVEVQQTNAGIQIGLAIPGVQAGTQRRHVSLG